MYKKLSAPTIAMLLSLWVVSCNTKSPDQLIVGTWKPISPKFEDMGEIKIKFLPNKIGVAERKGEAPAPRDTVTYELKNEGKLLVTTEKSGRVDEVEILELNDKNLIILNKKNNDTLKLIRE